MKNDSNVPYWKIIKLVNKPKFTVLDLINVLKNLDENAEINFGVIDKKAINYVQNENFIFELNFRNTEDYLDDNYIVNILTEYKL